MIRVLLVDENDNITGTGEKLDVHRKGLLHRAFSVFIFDENGKVLIQKRAERKYHSGGLWSNSCCSHQYEGETLFEAAQRCIADELGISMAVDETNAKEAGCFTYYSDLGQMKEHEIDHVICCRAESNTKINLNSEEASDVRWLSPDEIRAELKEGTGYTSWFERAFEIAAECIPSFS